MKIKRFLVFSAAGLVAIGLIFVVVVFSIDWASYKNQIEELASEQLGREVRIAGNFEPKLSLHPTALIEDLSIANPEWSTEDNFLTANRLFAQVQLWSVIRGPLIIERLELDGLSINAETNSDGESNWTFENQNESEEQQDRITGLPIIIDELQIVESTVTVRAPARADPIQVELESIVLTDSSRSGQLAGTILATIDNHEIAGAIALSTIQDLRAIDIDLTAPNATGIGELLGARIPEGESAQLSTKLSIDLQSAAMRFTANDLVVRVGDNEVRGQLDVMLDERTSIAAELNSSRLDFRGYTSPDDDESDAANESNDTLMMFPDDAELLSLANEFDLSANVNISQLITGFTEARNIQIPVALRDGNLTIGPAFGEVNGGTTEATIALSGEEDHKSLNIDFNASQLRLGAPIEDGFESATAQPPLDITAQLQGSGNTPHEIALSAIGNIVVIQGAGRRNQDALGVLANDFLAEIFYALNPFAEEDPYTEFECGAFRADVSDGLVTLSPLVMRTSKMVIVGDGTVDLETEGIDVSFNTKPRDGIGLAAAGLVTPFVKLSGTLSEPSLGLDAGNAFLAGGIAIATGGISLFGKEMLDRLTAEMSNCADAFDEATGEQE